MSTAACALRRLRLDLTQNRQFTLSAGTEQLLAKVEEPITLRLYASRALRDANPFLGSYADRVHDLLRTYAEASNGKIVVEYIDPEPFSPEEDRAVGFGLEPIVARGRRQCAAISASPAPTARTMSTSSRRSRRSASRFSNTT